MSTKRKANLEEKNKEHKSVNWSKVLSGIGNGLLFLVLFALTIFVILIWISALGYAEKVIQVAEQTATITDVIIVISLIVATIAVAAYVTIKTDKENNKR